MKKIMIAVFVLLTIFSSIVAFSTDNDVKVGAFEKTASIDQSKVIQLGFERYTVKVIKWDKDYLKCKSNLILGEKQNYEILTIGNKVTVKTLKGSKNNKDLVSSWTWLPLMQFKEYQEQFSNLEMLDYDFVVYVPAKSAVRIHGKYIRTDGCTVAYVKGGEAEIRDGILTKDFAEDVDALTVRDCKVPKNIVFQKKPGDIRDNKRID